MWMSTLIINDFLRWPQMDDAWTCGSSGRTFVKNGMGNAGMSKAFHLCGFWYVFLNFLFLCNCRSSVDMQKVFLQYEYSCAFLNYSKQERNIGSRGTCVSCWCYWRRSRLAWFHSHQATDRHCPAPPAEDAQLTLGSGCHYINKWVAKTILLSWFLISFKQQEPRKICYFLMDYISEVTFVILNLHCKLSYLPFMKSWN